MWKFLSMMVFRGLGMYWEHWAYTTKCTYLEYQNEVTGFSITPWSYMLLNTGVIPHRVVSIGDIPTIPLSPFGSKPLKWVASAKVWCAAQTPVTYKVCSPIAWFTCNTLHTAIHALACIGTCMDDACMGTCIVACIAACMGACTAACMAVCTAMCTVACMGWVYWRM